MFSPELRAKAEELIGRYPVGRSALLPLLHLVQAQEGHITEDGVRECAELLGLTTAEVGAVATFYSMYKREPLGRHLVSVCTNFACKVRGAKDVYERLSAKLGVGHNETTPDGAITLEHAECLGNCEGAPVVTVDYLNYECVSPDAAEELVERVRAGDPPPPTRGITPPGIREISYQLAGLGPRNGLPGAEVGFARASDGGLVPEQTAEVGPGAHFVRIELTFAEGQEAERERARAAVRDAGHEPDDVQETAGPRAREFPTTDPDWEPGQRREGRGQDG